MTWRYRWGCIRILVAQLALLGSGMLVIALTGIGIDSLRHAVDPSAHAPKWLVAIAPPAHWPPLKLLAIAAAAISVAAGVRFLLSYLSGVWFGELLQGQLVVDLRAQCYDKLQRLSFRFFDSNASSSLINRVAGDIQSVRLFVDGVLLQIILLSVSVVASLGYMLAVHVKLTLACVGTMPLVWIASSAFSKKAHAGYKRSSELNDNLVQRLAESIRGIRVIKAFGKEQSETQKFEEANGQLREEQHWIFNRVTIFVPLILLLSQANIIVLLSYGGLLAVNGEIGIGTGLVGFAAILQQFAGQIAGIGNIANTTQQCIRSAARVFEILDAPVQIESACNAQRLRKITGSVCFEDVSFDYGKEPILRHISFEAKPGDCVAIVGPIGSGKSTLLSLIPRFYDPGSGTVRIDGADARSLALDQVRQSVGLVFQESFLFSTTVAANIAFGKPDATREQIECVARIASAHEFISRLPQGYDTVLGEAGVGLSGGQKQRIAIARALLLEPSILLLDDPTASVDPGTEHEIVEAMEAAMAGRTTFMVAHRPSMLKRATLILVLDKGRIVQRGTHQELMGQPGYYFDSATMQASGEVVSA
jgi:ATP-binding cassette subfamily B protein